MPLTPDSVLLTDRLVVVTGAGPGHRRRGRVTLRPLRCRRRDLRPRRRRSGARPPPRSRPPAGTRTPRCSTSATATRCATWIAPLERVDVLVNNAGGGFRGRVPRRQRQGPGLAGPGELHERHELRPGRAFRSMPADGRVDRQHHVDRGAPRRAGFRGLQRDEGRAREPHQVARARARRPAHPGQLHRARRHPDAGHRRRAAGEDAAARRRSRRRRRRRGDLPRVRLGRGSSPAPRSTSTAATSPRAAGAGPATAAGSPRASRSREPGTS